ncbi:MAG: tail fiber domain-containing protein [bacterium]
MRAPRIPRSPLATVSLLVLLLLIHADGRGQSSRVTSYQGRLVDATGAPIDTTVDITFRIYDSDNGGAPAWTQTHPAVVVQDGVFNVMLSFVSNAQSIFTGSSRWMTVQVGDGAESDPRIQLGQAPYAYHAEVADTADYALASATSGGSGWTDDGTVVRLTTENDSIGIGTSSPTEKLEISGNCRVSGSIIVGNNTVVYGYDASAIGADCTNRGDSSLLGGYGSIINETATHAVVFGGYFNQTGGRYATISGGMNNQSNHSEGTTIGGGQFNVASGDYATIAGGGFNGARGAYSFVGGGDHDSATADYATIGGGYWNRATGAYSVIAGGDSNLVDQMYCFIGGGTKNEATSHYATVAGGVYNVAGGHNATVSGGWDNEAGLDHSTVGGGQGNRANGRHTTIAGGQENYSNGPWGGVAAGWSNRAGNLTSDTANFIGGGYDNDIYACEFATIAGGYGNRALEDYSFVGGGRQNAAHTRYGTVAGGSSNEVQGESATVGGGYYNDADGVGATVPGGAYNDAAGDYSFAAGRYAEAQHDGCFVWADDGITPFTSTGPGQFLIEAAGGVGINNATPLGALDIAQNADEVCLHFSNGTRDITWEEGHTLQLGEWNGTYWTERMRIASNGNVGINETNPLYKLDVDGDIQCTHVYETSDVRLKRSIGHIDHALDKVENIRGVSFEWTDEVDSDDGRQLGVIAQEVETVLPELVSTDSEGYKSVDYGKLTAVLIEAVKELRSENRDLRSRLEALEAK